MEAKRQTTRIWGQINFGSNSVPRNVLTSEPTATQRRVGLPKGDHGFEEPEDILICLELSPIQPTDFVVLVVGIIVSELCIQELVTGAEHRDAVGQEKQTAEVLNL